MGLKSTGFLYQESHLHLKHDLSCYGILLLLQSVYKITKGVLIFIK
jgi:hypothetical protein